MDVLVLLLLLLFCRNLAGADFKLLSGICRLTEKVYRILARLCRLASSLCSVVVFTGKRAVPGCEAPPVSGRWKDAATTHDPAAASRPQQQAVGRDIYYSEVSITVCYAAMSAARSSLTSLLCSTEDMSFKCDCSRWN